MKSLLLLFVITLTLKADKAFQKLAVLVGVWKMETGRGIIYEEWRVLNENTLSGWSYKVWSKDTVTLETILLQQVDTSVYYIPIVEDQNNKQPVKFKLKNFSENTFTFENNEHDFPQRIIYRIVSNDSIVARVEGTKNGNGKFSDFYYGRVK